MQGAQLLEKTGTIVELLAELLAAPPQTIFAYVALEQSGMVVEQGADGTGLKELSANCAEEFVRAELRLVFELDVHTLDRWGAVDSGS